MEENMKKLSDDIYKLKSIPIHFTQFYTRYGFESIEEFKIILDIIMWTRNLNWVREVSDRGSEQDTFRKNLIARDGKCIVSQKNIPRECEGCHIIPYSEGGDFSIDNGLLISSTLHKLFDDFIWSINPSDYTIDILCEDEDVVGSILEYAGKKINVVPTESMSKNLEWHWNKYLEHKFKNQIQILL